MPSPDIDRDQTGTMRLSVVPQPTVSMVIPLYNKAAEITRAVRSVVVQRPLPLEVIVVDDGSTDGGADVVEALGHPLVRVIRQANAGVSRARNTGIAAAAGDLVAFLDGDDEILDGHLAALIRLAVAFPQAPLVCTNYYFKEADRAWMPRLPGLNDGAVRRANGLPDDLLTRRFFRLGADGDLLVSASSCAIRRSVLAEIGAFPVGEPMGEDQDLWARCALRGPIAFCKVPTAVYHLVASNRACRRNVPKAELPFSQRLQDRLDAGTVPVDMVGDVRAFITRHLLHLAAENVRSGDANTALNILREDRRCWRSPLRALYWSLRAVAGCSLSRGAAVITRTGEDDR